MLLCAAGCSPDESGSEQQETEAMEQAEQQEAPEATASQGKQSELNNSSKVTRQHMKT